MNAAASGFPNSVRQELSDLGAFWGTHEAREFAPPCQPLYARARPLQRQGRAHRSGDLPPRLSRADAALDACRAALLLLRPGRGRGGHAAPGEGGAVLHDGADRVRPPLPDDHDKCLARAAEARAGAPRHLGAAHPVAHLRPQLSPGHREAGRHRRHGDDGEAGRHGCPRQPDKGGPGRRRSLPYHRPQMVLFGPDVGCVPGIGAGGGGTHLFPDAEAASRRDRECDPARAAEGEARQPLERLRGGGVRRRDRVAGRQRGAGDRHDTRDGDPDAARLRGRERRSDAGRFCGSGSSCPPSRSLRQAADRPASDAAGARGHGARSGRRRGTLPAPCGSLRHGATTSRRKPPMRV